MPAHQIPVDIVRLADFCAVSVEYGEKSVALTVGSGKAKRQRVLDEREVDCTLQADLIEVAVARIGESAEFAVVPPPIDYVERASRSVPAKERSLRAAEDFNAVNVALVSDQDTYDFRYVAGVDRCDLADLGWYYDVDPMSGEKPTKISVCRDACQFLQSKNNARVEVRLGCLTRGPD